MDFPRRWMQRLAHPNNEHIAIEVIYYIVGNNAWAFSVLLRALLNVAWQQSSLCVCTIIAACVCTCAWRNLGTHYRVSKHTYTCTHMHVCTHACIHTQRADDDELGVCLSNITFVSRPGTGLNNRGNVSTNAMRALRCFTNRKYLSSILRRKT